jgi:hypothetical protein
MDWTTIAVTSFMTAVVSLSGMEFEVEDALEDREIEDQHVRYEAT